MAELSTHHVEPDRQQVVAAGQKYQAALTRWHRNQRGPRPADPRPELEQRIRDLEADFEALTNLVSETLATKAEYVEVHRRGLVRDMRQAADDAEHRYR